MLVRHDQASSTSFLLRRRFLVAFWLLFTTLSGAVATLGFSILSPATLLTDPPLGNTHLLYYPTLLPALLLLLPALTTVLTTLGAEISLGDLEHAYCAVWFSLWAPVNTLVVIYFVTPYRRYTRRCLLGWWWMWGGGSPAAPVQPVSLS